MMRVLCDVHIPYRLVTFLRQRDVDATHVNRILNKWHTTDAAITAYADDSDSVLITKDGDFRDSHFLTGKPARLLRITLGNLSNDALIALFDQYWGPLQVELANRPSYVELGTEGLRVYRHHP
jgi:predicted nuclease of predicted toxin-antitoxin system